MIERGLEGAGWLVGRGAARLASAARVPGQLLARGAPRADPDVGRLGVLPFDEARRLPAPDGGDLFTTTHGDGPSFVFVHGFAVTSRIWTKQFRDLPAAGARVLAFDHRGHGASTPAFAGAEIESLADDLRVVLEGLDVRDGVLVGHAMGGMALLSFAVRHPEVLVRRVRGLVLVSTTARLRIATIPLARRVLLPFVAGFVHSGACARSDWSRLAARVFFGPDPFPSQVELVRALLASARMETLIGAMAAMAGFDGRRYLASVDIPTLVVTGTADLITTPGEARRLARGLPDARLELVPGAGHMIMLERAETLDALLCSFARDLGIAVGLAA